MRVRCLTQEHNTMSPVRARTQTTRSGVERANYEATAPPTVDLGRGAIFVTFREITVVGLSKHCTGEGDSSGARSNSKGSLISSWLRYKSEFPVLDLLLH